MLRRRLTKRWKTALVVFLCVLIPILWLRRHGLTVLLAATDPVPFPWPSAAPNDYRNAAKYHTAYSIPRMSRDQVNGIPKILHYVFKSQTVFNTYKPFIQGCLERNPDWRVMFWSDADSLRLIKQHYGHFAVRYNAYRDRLEKSDSVRYMILHKVGGVYLDMDVECLQNFNRLLRQVDSEGGSKPASAFLGEERREQTRILYDYSYCTMNSLMGSRPGHPFFNLTINRMLAQPMLSHARLTTGPEFLTKMYLDWLNCSTIAGRLTDCQASHPVTVFPASLVSPLMDTSLVDWRKKCKPYLSGTRISKKETWKAVGCSELVAKKWNVNETDNSTIAVHRFLHLGYGNQGNRPTFDILKEFPRVKTFY